MCDHVYSQEIHLICEDGLIIFMLHAEEKYSELLKSPDNKNTSIRMRNVAIQIESFSIIYLQLTLSSSSLNEPFLI